MRFVAFTGPRGSENENGGRAVIVTNVSDVLPDAVGRSRHEASFRRPRPEPSIGVGLSAVALRARGLDEL